MCFVRDFNRIQGKLISRGELTMKRSLAIALLGAVWGLGAIGIHAWSQEDVGKSDQDTTKATVTDEAAQVGIAQEGDQDAPDVAGGAEEITFPVPDEGPTTAELKVMVDTLFSSKAGSLPSERCDHFHR